MLRHIYFLSFFLCINISFCYDYLSRDELNPKRVSKKFRIDSRKSRKLSRGNEDVVYDTNPNTQIDVASFIQSPELLNSNLIQTYNDNNDFGNYGHKVNSDDEINKDDSQEYQNLESDNIPEVNVLDAKHFIPQHLNLNGISIGQTSSQTNEPFKLESIQDDFPFDTKVGHISRTEKKCALKNMKIPFFSHDKAVTTNAQKNKKRRLFGFGRKQNSDVSKTTLKSNEVKPTENPQNLYKLNKRSYYEKLCPACKVKFLSNSNSDLAHERVDRLNDNTIHNSRQYFQKKLYSPKVAENDKPYNFEMKPNRLKNNIDYEMILKDRRWKRDDETIEAKQKRVLEEIEKKVDSVKVNILDN